jgi:hypothetical protein
MTFVHVTCFAALVHRALEQEAIYVLDFGRWQAPELFLPDFDLALYRLGRLKAGPGANGWRVLVMTCGITSIHATKER